MAEFRAVAETDPFAASGLGKWARSLGNHIERTDQVG